jgi:hypothetical protein
MFKQRLFHMTKPKLGRGLAALTASGPAILATKEAAAADEVGAAMRLEQIRFERATIDFESEIRRQRDRMHREHLASMAAILSESV